MFRRQLFNVCKVEFEKFFDEDELKKSKKDKESEILFKVKLFGNIEFLGELYRRKLLPQTTLISVFQSLLGMSEVNEDVNDLVIEGAINLMSKVGEEFEKNISAAKKAKAEAKESFDAIVARFKWAQEHEEAPITNRTKLLIKNMFQDRDDGWKKTQEMHKGGPKTKAEVQKEVEDKYKNEEKARQQRDGNRGGGYGQDNRRDNRGYNDRDQGKGDRRDGGKPQYREKGNNGGGGSYGNGGRETRDNQKGRDDRKGGKRNDTKEAQVVALDDEEMGGQLKKNFESYAMKMKAIDDGMVDPEEEDTKPEELLSIYEEFKTRNGKAPPVILFQLLSKIFDEDMTRVENYFKGYLDAIVAKKIFKAQDFGEGISKVV